jgi:hypothetical protein
MRLVLSRYQADKRRNNARSTLEIGGRTPRGRSCGRGLEQATEIVEELQQNVATWLRENHPELLKIS